MPTSFLTLVVSEWGRQLGMSVHVEDPVGGAAAAARHLAPAEALVEAPRDAVADIAFEPCGTACPGQPGSEQLAADPPPLERRGDIEAVHEALGGRDRGEAGQRDPRPGQSPGLAGECRGEVRGAARHRVFPGDAFAADRSEEHTTELQSLMRTSY